MHTSVTKLSSWCHSQLQSQASLPNLKETDLVLTALPVEASHRHFYRVQDKASALTWVAMWSPPELENNAQFLALAKVFAGLGTPAVLAQDQDLGFFLMEDLGDTHLADGYSQAANNQDRMAHLVNTALDGLVGWQQVNDPQIPAYDQDRLVMEFDLCQQWLVDGLMEQAVSDQDAQVLSHSRNALVAAMLDQPQVCVHRDYHCRNLLIIDKGETTRLGIVDFQDALIGPALYDVASLLRDCYYRHDENLIASSLARFAANSPQLSAASSQQVTWWHDACAIQRQVKAIGIFARLHLRDAKSSHLGYILPVLERLVTLTGAYPELWEFSELLQVWSRKGQTLSQLQTQLGQPR